MFDIGIVHNHEASDIFFVRRAAVVWPLLQDTDRYDGLGLHPALHPESVGGLQVENAYTDGKFSSGDNYMKSVGCAHDNSDPASR